MTDQVQTSRGFRKVAHMRITTKKKTLGYSIPWCSLHRRRPQSGRFAAFVAVVGDDFFLVDVM